MNCMDWTDSVAWMDWMDCRDWMDWMDLIDWMDPEEADGSLDWMASMA